MAEEEKNEQASEGAEEQAPEVAAEAPEPEAAEPAEEAEEAPAEEPSEEPPAEEPPAEEAPAEEAPAAEPEEGEAVAVREPRASRMARRGDPAQREAYRRKRSAARRAWRVRRRAKRVAARPAEPAAPPAPPKESVRPRERQGIVVSDKADKTITVRIDVTRQHREYKKVVRETSTLHAHDERNEAHQGDTVRVVESRPLSRTKRWRLVEVLERAR
jgi:small subunit ribosomal protein S17